MPSFLDKLRAGSSTTASASAAASKKDPKDANLTWLQKLQQDPDPIRMDGSDKFFGAENFGNTCYFNSMVQSLYYSVPFREMVLSYPARSSTASILNDADGIPRKIIREPGQTNGQPVTAAPKRPPNPAPNAPSKPEDKESADYKKKQALLNGPVLNVDYNNAASYGMTPSLFTGLKDAFEVMIAMNSRTGVLSMSRFLETLRQDHEMFRSPMHQDAHEFLNILLNGVIEGVEAHTKELEKQPDANGTGGDAARSRKALITAEESKKQHTHFQRLFQGTLTNETRCLTCENVSQRDEPFLDLSVDIEQHSSVTSCLRQFSEEEMLCERDKFFCDKCGGLQEAEKRMKVKRLPRILALHLKRFKYTEDLQRLQKLFHRVVYPYHLRLFNTTNDAEDPDKLYELYAVVVHIGSGPYHGHYVSIIKTPERGWLLFDDELVEPVDKSFVRNFFGAQIGMACAYVLFYQETTLEAVKQEQQADALMAAQAAAEAAQPISKDAKESHGLLALKINGITGGPTSPLQAQDEDGAKLAQVASAPAATLPSPGAPPLSPGLMPIPTSATLSPEGAKAAHQPSSPVAAPSKAEKKQAAKEEKERKAAEKEREKAEKAAEKARRKSMETRSRTQAAAVRTTIITGKRPDAPLSAGSGSADVATPVASNGVTATAAGGAGSAAPTLPPSTLPGTSPSLTQSAPDGDEIAPAPLPSAASPALVASSGDPKTAAPPPVAVGSTTTGTTGPAPSPKEKDSSWPRSLSLRRSSKSLGKKPKLWDRLSGADGKGNASAAGASSLSPGLMAPTSHPTSSKSAPASSIPPVPPLLPALVAAASPHDEVAVEDADSSNEGLVPLIPKDLMGPPPPSKEPVVRVWQPPVPLAKDAQHTALPRPPSQPEPIPGSSYAAFTAPPPAQDVPPPSSTGTEANASGGTPKKRGFSSIRKRASNLLS